MKQVPCRFHSFHSMFFKQQSNKALVHKIEVRTFNVRHTICITCTHTLIFASDILKQREERKSGKFYSKHVDIILCKVRRIIIALLLLFSSFLSASQPYSRFVFVVDSSPGKKFLYPLLLHAHSVTSDLLSEAKIIFTLKRFTSRFIEHYRDGNVRMERKRD